MMRVGRIDTVWNRNMRTIASILAVFGLTLALAGCGGSSGCGSLSGSGSATATGSCSSTPTPPPGTSKVASLTVAAGAASIPADGSQAVGVTALAKDANNNALSNVAVTLSSSGGTLTGATTTTDKNGYVTAILSAGGMAAGSTITVTATSGSVTGKATVNVVAAQQSLTLLTSVPQIPSNGSTSATITALVRDATNNVVPNVPVVFQADSGSVSVVNGTTDTKGTATATLNAAGNLQNRTITVNATAGTSNSSVTVAVVGTSLAISGPSNLVQGGNGSYSITLTDSANTGIANQTVTLASTSGNTVPASVTTNSTGTATFTVTATKAGNDTITASALGLQAAQQVAVSNQSFSITAPAANANLTVGVAAPVTVQWVASGTAQTGTVTFAASRGTLSTSSSTLQADGTLNPAVTITSTTAGPSIISASAGGVTAQVTVDFIATNPSSVSVQASPSTVVVQGQSTITATVIDPANNPVQGATVDFTLTDPTGGSLSQASAQTNAQGQATISYTASSGASAPNGVQIAAKVRSTTIGSTTTLTVGGQAVFLSLGTGNTIYAYSNTQYALPYTVQAVDASGKGLANAAISFSVKSVGYLEGFHMWVDADKFWDTVSTTTASDPHAFLGVEGVHGCQPAQVWELNGQIVSDQNNPPANSTLTTIPGLVVSTAELGPPTVPSQQSATTGTDGTAAVSLIYPKDHAYYVAVALTATATVQGTQSSTTAVFWIPGASADFNQLGVAPPGPASPYGSGAVDKTTTPWTISPSTCY